MKDIGNPPIFTRGSSQDADRSSTPWYVPFAWFVGLWLAWVLATTFFVQPFRVPSPSMTPTLGVGDRLIVEKYDHSVHRGDVVVFTDPGGWTPPSHPNVLARAAQWLGLSARGDHVVKRVIGVGGDHVSCDGPGSRTVVNGHALIEPYLHGQSACSSAYAIVVPRDHMWVMGDNRGDSYDSRGHDDGTGNTGSVDLDHVTGRVVSSFGLG